MVSYNYFWKGKYNRVNKYFEKKNRKKMQNKLPIKEHINTIKTVTKAGRCD